MGDRDTTGPSQRSRPSLPAAPVSSALLETARIEIHSFKSVALTDQQFLTGRQDGIPARLGGELRLPPGNVQIPGAVLVHGSGGIGTNVLAWATALNSIGVAALLVDSFTDRGIADTIADQSQLGSLAMIVDAFRALQMLSRHPRIDPARIAVMGFSKGGFAALYASLQRFQLMHGSAGTEFAAYISFYPQCNTRYLADEQVGDRPIRLFHGTADDYVSIEPCRSYVQRLRRAGKDVQLTEYPRAGHAFDNPQYSPARFLPDAITVGRCARREQDGGEVLNVGTGQPFRWSDACVKRGATVSHDPLATHEATKSVKAFLIDHFKLGG